jgi:N utilization substance protein B
MAVQVLFQLDFNSDKVDDVLSQFFDDRKAGPKIRAFTEELVRGVLEHRATIDACLQRCAHNWDLKRMGAVDRNVMRVALYEMQHRTDIPPVVSINEAVETAKELSSEESGKFVNGILDKARQELSRPARTATNAAESGAA